MTNEEDAMRAWDERRREVQAHRLADSWHRVAYASARVAESMDRFFKRVSDWPDGGKG